MALKNTLCSKKSDIPFQIETVIFQYLSAIKSYLVQYYLIKVSRRLHSSLIIH